MPSAPTRHPKIFTIAVAAAGLLYPLFIALLLLYCAIFSRTLPFTEPWQDPDIRFAAVLSLRTSLLATLISMLLAIPCGYMLSRYRIPGKRVYDILLYMPIVLPPLVLGVCLLILFQTTAGRLIETHLLRFTFAVPGLILAQVTVSAAFATRIVKLAFDHVPKGRVAIARTLGARAGQAFWHIELPEARSGLVEAAVLAWATAFGSFGPIILFVGTTRGRTEVLSTSIFLQFSIGELDKALVLSLWMAATAAIVLLLARGFGGKPLW